jgi:two-component system sensor histidine kinase TctE
MKLPHILGVRHPSLKKRLLLTLLVPLCAILLGLGAAGAWLSHRIVQNVSDRVLSGSLQAISETLAMQEGYLTMELPPSALGMLENADRDNVYYSVSYRGKLVTGYPELGLAATHPPLEEIEFRDSAFRGTPIRVATEARLVPQLDSPVIVQVAETMNYRAALSRRMLTALTASEIFLLMVVATLVFLGVHWGLMPLSALRREVEARNSAPDTSFAPLPLSTVPQEALPFVSAFNALLGHVETAFQTLRRFTSDASHQLRAPLAVVRTHVELLARHSAGSPELKGAITDIYQAVRALQHLMAQLISLAKAERPTDDDLDSSDCFDLVECTAATARNYATNALRQGMTLSFDTACEELAVIGNPIFAGEMIANLLDNAIRYGEQGGHIAVRIPDDSGLLEIEDDGPGIPPSDRERVFERFFRLPRNVDREGSGLGLSIVQALGRRMGASVALQTADSGRGLKAVIHFQLVYEPAEAELSPAE